MTAPPPTAPPPAPGRGAGRRFYLIGPAGIPNLGDELIARTWLEHLAATAPEAEVVLDCLGYFLAGEAGVAHLAGAHPRLRFTDTVWRLVVTSGSWEADAVTAAARERILGRVPDEFAEGVDLAARSDTVHLLGGGYINSVWSQCLGLAAAAAALGERGGARTAMTGQGLWPQPDGTGALLRTLLRGFDTVDCRDARSCEAAGASAALTCDDVFLADLGTAPAAAAGAPDVMVSVQSRLAGQSPQRLVAAVADCLREWGADSVGLVECAPEDDAEILALARKELPVTRHYPLPELLADGLPARPGQVWISTRFHPHLLAAAAGASGVALQIDPDYYSVKHRSLLDQGSAWSTVRRLPGTRPAAGGFPADAVQRLHAAKTEVARKIYG